MSRHSFEPEIAKQVGVNAAVIYQNIIWWAEKNAANGRHQHDNLWWTYNSIAAFAELFPYLTGKQIRVALDKLEEAGLIVSGNFNKSPYDRTKWYAPTCLNGLSDLPTKANEVDQKGKPIPDSKPVIKPDDLNCASNDAPMQPDLIEDDDKVTVEMVVEAWNITADIVGKPKVQRMSDGRKQVVRARIKQNTIDDFATVFRNIEQSDFLRNWKSMGFDWVMKAGNFQKILEGNYNNG